LLKVASNNKINQSIMVQSYFIHLETKLMWGEESTIWKLLTVLHSNNTYNGIAKYYIHMYTDVCVFRRWTV
jgi:hypothetical protein